MPEAPQQAQEALARWHREQADIATRAITQDPDLPEDLAEPKRREAAFHREAASLIAALSAPAQREVAEPVATWPAHWREHGYNGCLSEAHEAMRYLANNARPVGGSSRFNAEHLLQIARELERTRIAFAALAVTPHPAPSTPAQPTNVEDAARGNAAAIRHVAYAEGYRDGKAAALAPSTPALTVVQLSDLLESLGLIDPAAINDPEGYDGGRTQAKVAELHRSLTSAPQPAPSTPALTEDDLREMARRHGCFGIGSRLVDAVAFGREVAALASAPQPEQAPAPRELREGEPTPPNGDLVPQCPSCVGCREWGGNGLWHHASCNRAPAGWQGAWFEPATPAPSPQPKQAPAARQPLTEGEIQKAVGADAQFWATSKLWIVSIARAIEAAHGIAAPSHPAEGEDA